MEMYGERFKQIITEGLTNMSTKKDVFNRLENFEKRWDELCKQLETTEMPRHDAERWDSEFREEKNVYQKTIPDSIQNEFYNEIYPRLDQVGHKVSVAILKARANFRKNEKIRLKDAYGSLGEIIYFVLKIIRERI